MTALLKEIRARSAAADGKTVRSVFIGGGTPSLIGEAHITALMSAVRQAYDVADGAEISIESNPCTLTEKKLDAYLNAGINRLSIGCQSTDDNELKLLGRLHTFDGFIKAYEAARRCGFTNLNADMIYALPYQTAEKWRGELEMIAGLDISHISAYSLILEEGTELYEKKGGFVFPDDETAAEMFEAADEILSKSGFIRYEISNYAKPGFECIHNLGYWRRVPYIGFGLGASSYYGKTRRSNTSDIKKYIAFHDAAELEENVQTLEARDEYAEFAVLGLRLADGISRQEFFDEFGRDIFDVFGDQLEKHIKNGTLVSDGGRIYIPKKYLFVSNPILADFI